MLHADCMLHATRSTPPCRTLHTANHTAHATSCTLNTDRLRCDARCPPHTERCATASDMLHTARRTSHVACCSCVLHAASPAGSQATSGLVDMVMVYIVMASAGNIGFGRYSYGLCSYGSHATSVLVDQCLAYICVLKHFAMVLEDGATGFAITPVGCIRC